MNLSSISFSSVQNALYSSYNAASTSRNSGLAASRPANVVSISSAAPEGGSVVARHFGRVLHALTAGDAGEAKVAVAALQESLAQRGGEQGEGLAQVLDVVARRLESPGGTTRALAELQSFLLGAGPVTGRAFSTRV